MSTLSLSLARTLRQRTPQISSSIQSHRRWFAEVVNVTPSSSETDTAVPVPTTAKPVNWRKQKVPVIEDHGLYAFFRKKEAKDGEEFEGEERFEVAEPPQSFHMISGRGWKAEELRLKSFKDLHTLWYILLRERNLLATQKEEARRMGVQNTQFQVNGTKVYHVKKSMARIKQILNERRLAFEKAHAIATAGHETDQNDQVLTYLRNKELRNARALANKPEQAVEQAGTSEVAKEPAIEAVEKVVERTQVQA